jgi:hypothetical protein
MVMTTISLPEDHIIDMAQQSLKRPEDFGYWGNVELFHTWGWAGIDYNRDSGVLDRANYQAFHRDIVSQYEDHFTSERMNHWAVGWVERTLVKVLHNDVDGVIYTNITQAFCETLSALESLQEYPVLDDALYSDMEWEENMRVIEEVAPEMINHDIEGWSEKLLSALYDNDVEMIPDADCYASEDDMMAAAYDCGLCDKQYEEEWLEYCFDNNLTKPAIFQPKQTIGQLGMRI